MSSGSNPAFSSESIVSPHSALTALHGISSSSEYDLRYGNNAAAGPGPSSARSPRSAPRGPPGSSLENERPQDAVSHTSNRVANGGQDGRSRNLAIDTSTTASASTSGLTAGSRSKTAISTSPQSGIQPSHSRLQPQPPEWNGKGNPPQPPLVVRALFNFSATDTSALSFTVGDVIDVITTLESGWWDGMLGDERGWFPSNFVEVIDPEELEALEQEEAVSPAGGRFVGEATSPSRAGGGRRSIGAGSVLRIDDALGSNWGDAGGDAVLEDLARSMGVPVSDLGRMDEFAIAARRHQARAQGTADDSGTESRRDGSPSQPQHHAEGFYGNQFAGNSGNSAEGFDADLREAARVKRERENTAGTIRPGATNQGANGLTAERAGLSRLDTTPQAPGRARDSAQGSGNGGESDDAWIPCLTPDGQVYYHNTLTGEDSWELPIVTPDEENSYANEEIDYFPSPSTNPPSSIFPSQSTIPFDATGLRPPPKTVSDIPHPWVSRLSDDGREWYYVNRETGEVSRDLPKPSTGFGPAVVDLNEGMENLDVNGGNVPPPASKRYSAEMRRKALLDWKPQARQRLEGINKPPDSARPTLVVLLDNVNDSLRDVFEAAVAGSAAEEEMSRASHLNSQPGLAAALARENVAVDMLVAAHGSVLIAITDLLRSFGYIGPIDKVEDMNRPGWTGDMTLIGSIGVFSANIHAAVHSKRVPESGAPIWQEVTRSASRLRDVISNFPKHLGAATGHIGEVSAEGSMRAGKLLAAWLGLDNVGDLFRGRWGFGAESRRALDQAVVAEAQHIHREFETALESYDPTQDEGNELEMLRIADRFKAAIWGVDIGAVVDIDSEQDEVLGNGPAQDDARRKYVDLVSQARHALRDLDNAFLDIDQYSALYYTSLATSADPASLSMSLSPIQLALGSLSQAILAAQRSLSNMLIITSEQAAIISRTSIRNRLGARSPRLPVPGGSSQSAQGRRPISTVSTTSRVSQASRTSALEAKRNKVRGIEDDFQESEDLASERVDLTNSEMSGVRPSGSGSQPKSRDRTSGSSDSASLASVARGGSGKRRDKDASAASSTTSLAYQRTESDSGSIKGPRTSFLKNIMGGGRSKSGAPSSYGNSAGGGGGFDPESEASRRNKKKATKNLAKLLGDDIMWTAPSQPPDRTPPSATSPTVPGPPPPLTLQAVPEIPAYLGEDYAPEDIVYDDKGGVKAGTLGALVVRLTPHGSTDTSFFQAFMLTFRSFTSGDQLLDILFERYHVKPPPDLTPDQLADWVKSKQTPIRLRIANVLRAWMDVHFMVDQDSKVLDRIEHFASVTMLEGNSDMLTMLSKTLLNLVARRRRGEDPNQRRIVSGGMLSPPAPLVPRVSGKTLQLTDIAPLELARQLTIIEFQNFQKIKPAECLHKAWTNENEELAPNVRTVIHTANKLAAWVGLLVLQPRDSKSRASLMKHFIQTAIATNNRRLMYQELRNMNNFSSMAGITAGLNAAPVDRLKRTKEHLSNKTSAMKDDLDRTMDSSKNFANYKETLKTINPPCVPFLGFYLSALTFIEDGNKDIINPAQLKQGMTPSASASSLSSFTQSGITRLSASMTSAPSSTTSITGPSFAAGTATSPISNGASVSAPGLPAPSAPLINFFKRFLSAEILRDIQQYQSQPYNLAKCRPVYEFLVSGLERVESSGDLYERSLLLEPREREEERM